jgi:hypothetical protein
MQAGGDCTALLSPSLSVSLANGAPVPEDTEVSEGRPSGLRAVVPRKRLPPHPRGPRARGYALKYLV